MAHNESDKRMIANQRNASLSTGPKSERGKAIVKWNAVKRGLFSREVLIRKGDGKENKAEFDRLAKSLWEDLQPKGALEETLADRIIVCFWRLKRVTRYEVAVLRSHLDTGIMDRHNRTVARLENVILMNRYGGLKKELSDTSIGINFLRQILAEAREQFVESGTIDSEVLRKLVTYFGKGEGSIAAIYSNYIAETTCHDDEESSAPKNAEELEELKEARDEVLAAIDDELEMLDSRLECILEIEQLKSENYLATLCVPPQGPADQIMRYEASLERQVYRCIAALKELQRQRRAND